MHGVLPSVSMARNPRRLARRVERASLKPTLELLRTTGRGLRRDRRKADVLIRSDRVLVVVPDLARIRQLDVGEFAFETHGATGTTIIS